MNILIIQKSMGVGGVNVVSATLTRKFQEKGHKVVVFAFYEGDNDMPRDNYGDAPIMVGSGFKVCKDNILKMRNLLKEYKIDLIINQWGLSYVPTAVLKKACKDTQTKWISYYHSDPLFNGKTHDVEIALEHDSNSLKWILNKIKLYVMQKATSKMMKYNYQACWRFMVLSDSYVSHFQQFTGLKNIKKLMVMNNPVTIDVYGFELCPKKKSKEVLYVGRLDPSNKRVSRLVEAWSIVEPQFCDWKLTIVGDGPEKEQIIATVNKYQLKNVQMVGQQNPRSYYERASLLGLTSDFEGWPLVLGECMSFGVVPVVYGTVDAIYDIVDDGKNGVIVPKVNGGFSVETMAKALIEVMQNENFLFGMMKKAQEKSKDYSLDTIYNRWEKVFEEFRNERKSTIS